jgi:DNA-directed RNA polymerase specialized sigma subunit
MTDARMALYQYASMQAEITRIEHRIGEMRSIMADTCEPLRAFVAQQTPSGQTNKTSDPTCEAVQRLIDIYGTEIKELTERLETVKEDIRQVDEAIFSAELTPDEYNVIQFYYCDGKRWDWISEEIHYSESQCRRYRNRAMSKIQGALKRCT